MFRLEELKGKILIDGLETGTIGVHDLRQKLSIIPQEAVLFNATVRKNLDPFDEHNDDAIWSALQEVQEIPCQIETEKTICLAKRTNL